METRLNRADIWAQALIAWEAANPTPAPSYYGKAECTAIQSIVAFKLASMSQHRRDGGFFYRPGSLLHNAAPRYDFKAQGMRDFFGGPKLPRQRSNENTNDPYELLGSRGSTEAQLCLVSFLLEPARLQYWMATFTENGMHRPIFMTNPNESYWEQLYALQSEFERDWVELGRTGKPPILYGLLKLNYDSMTWNSDQVPILNLVRHSIDCCTRTFVRRQRQQTQKLRAELRQRQRQLDFEDDKTDGEGNEEDEESDSAMMEESDGGEDDVVVGEGGGEEVVGEDETEEEEEDEMKEGEEV